MAASLPVHPERGICYPPGKAPSDCERLARWLQGIVDPARAEGYERGSDAIVLLESRWTVVKIPRLDSNYNPLREGLLLLRLSGRAPQMLAPRPYSFSPYHLRMERINCPGIEKLLEEGLKLGSSLACRMLQAAHMLDAAGVDHGELVRPYRHVRICPGGRVVFIDFSRASLQRRPSNLTSIASFLLSHTSILDRELAERVRKRRSEIIEVLREYKRSPEEAYWRVAFLLGCGEWASRARDRSRVS